jgi:Domain of unknown function (DUF4262)
MGGGRRSLERKQSHERQLCRKSNGRIERLNGRPRPFAARPNLHIPANFSTRPASHPPDNRTQHKVEQGRAGQWQNLCTDHRERKALADVAEFGWHSLNVLEDDGHPQWTFTIGFYETWEHPELIIIGRCRPTAHHILNTVATSLDNNHSYDLA